MNKIDGFKKYMHIVLIVLSSSVIRVLRLMNKIDGFKKYMSIVLIVLSSSVVRVLRLKALYMN